MIFRRIFLLFLLLAFLSACDNRETKQANEFAAKVFRAWDEYTGKVEEKYKKAEMPEMPEMPAVPKMPELVPEQLSKTVDEHTTKIAEAAGAAAAEQATKEVAKQVDSELEDVKQTASDVSSAASETAKKAKRHVRYYLRKVPRSQKEANDLVVEKSSSWAEELNRWLQQLGANGGIFGRRPSPSSYGKSPRNRLKGRSQPAARTPDRLRR